MIEVENTSMMNMFLNSEVANQTVMFPNNANLILVSSDVSDDLAGRIDEVALKARRSLHLYKHN